MTTADKIAELDAKATAGPWKACQSVEWDHYGVYPDTGKMEFPIYLAPDYRKPDVVQAEAALIVLLRNSVPEILTALRLAEQPLGDVAGLVERLRNYSCMNDHLSWRSKCEREAAATLTTLSRRNAELEAENALFLNALKFVGPGLLVLRNMCGTANLPIGEQRAKDMIEAVRQALGEKNDG